MSTKTHAAYKHAKFMYALVGESCPPFIKISETAYDEYRKSLDEIENLICHFQALGVQEEVANLRRMKMFVKMQMREIKHIIGARTLVKEDSYS